MPNEWDAYLLRMGRKAEVGAGAADDFNLDELRWTEVESAGGTPSDEGGAARRTQQPATTQRQGVSGRVSAKAETHECPGGKRAPMSFTQTSRSPEHVARSFPERARQFMPFAALKGYEEMLAEVERKMTAAQAGPKEFIPAEKIPQLQKAKRDEAKNTPGQDARPPQTGAT